MAKDKDIVDYGGSVGRTLQSSRTNSNASYVDIVPPEVVGFPKHQRNRKRSQSYVKFLKYQKHSKAGKTGSQDDSTSDGSEHSERYYQMIQKNSFYESKVDELLKDKSERSSLPPNRFASPTPLGLCAFSMGDFIISMYLSGAIIPMRHASNGVFYGIAFWYSGVVLVIVGLLELMLGNAFAGLTFTSYGGFFLSYSALFVQAFGFLTTINAYESTEVLDEATGIYCLAWAWISLMFVIGSLRTNMVLFLILVTVEGTFFFLTLSYFLENIYFARAAGISGIFSSFFGFYGAMAGLCTKDNNFFTLPVFPMDPIWKSMGLLGGNAEAHATQQVEARTPSSDKV